MKWASRILLVCAVMVFAPILRGEEIILNTISDLTKKKVGKNDILLVNPDIGTEVSRISTEQDIAKKVADFFKDKKAIGVRHNTEMGFYYQVFKVDPEAKTTSLTEKLRRLRGIRSNLVKLLIRQESFAYQQ